MSATVIDRDRQGSDTPIRERRRRLPISLIAVFIVGVSAACLVYLPWRNTPFDILDFSEFLPFLREHDSFAERFTEFASYYASQGRLNLLSYVFIIWKWTIFGWNEAGWQLARSAQMACIVIGVYMLLRRLGAERWGSVFGSALFVVAQTASPAWIRLTMGEPLGFAAVVGAALIAARYQETARWRAAGASIAALLTCAILAKEMLLALVPFVLLLGCARHGSGDFERPHFTRRNVWLVTITATGALAICIPVALVALRATEGTYATDYGRAPLSLIRFVYLLATIMLPVGGLLTPRTSFPMLIGNLLFLGILSAGWSLARTHATVRHHWLPLGGAAGALAVVGAAIYLPWPNFQAFYGLPFLLAPAIFLALAITAIERRRPSWRWAAYAGCVVMLVHAATNAARESRDAIAIRNINWALVADIVEHSSADSVVVARRDAAPQPWQGTGPTLMRYARAVHPKAHLPSAVDALCPATLPMYRNGVGDAMLVSYSNTCGTFPKPDRSRIYLYSYLSWPKFTVVHDSLRVDMLGPSGAR